MEVDVPRNPNEAGAGPVLYVDDEPHALKYFEAALGGEYEVITCSNVQEALEQLEKREGKVDAVVSDDRMRHDSGGDFLALVGARWPRSVRILTTAYASVERLCTCINDGRVDRVILKPWNIDHLRQVLSEAIVLSRSAMRRSTIAAGAEACALINDLSGALIRTELTAATLMPPLAQGAHEREIGVQAWVEQITARASSIHGELLRSNTLVRRLGTLADLNQNLGETYPCSLVDCLDKAISLASPTSRTRENIEVVAFDDITFMFEPECVSLAFGELVANSLRAVEDIADPRIRISTLTQDASVKVIIEDNGDWDRAEFLESLFEPASPDQERPNLGLSICNWFFTSNGASLSFKPAPGKGMQAIVQLSRILS